MGFLGQGKDEKARGVHIEAMDRGLLDASRNGGADSMRD